MLYSVLTRSILSYNSIKPIHRTGLYLKVTVCVKGTTLVDIYKYEARIIFIECKYNRPLLRWHKALLTAIQLLAISPSLRRRKAYNTVFTIGTSLGAMSYLLGRDNI